MNARVEFVRRALALALLVCTAIGAARGEDENEKRVREFLDAQQPGQALTACDAIPDAPLRAEWKFHVLYGNGDLVGALDAALAGLEQAPGHERLSKNALICALQLRRAEVAKQVRAQLAATPPDLAADLDLLADIDDAARRCTSRARTVAIASLLASALAMIVLARRTKTT